MGDAASDRFGRFVHDFWTEAHRAGISRRVYELAFRGVGRLVVSDTARAGTLAGPNLTALRRLLDAVPCTVAYGGGVAGVDDLRALRDLGRATLHAVLVATALAEHRLDPAAAVAVLEQGA